MDCYQSLNVQTDYELPSVHNTIKPHPCADIFLSSGVGEDYKSATFKSTHLYEKFKKGDIINPLTGIPYSSFTLEKLELYMKCQEKLPNYNIEKVKSSDIFTRWINSLKKNNNLSDIEKEVVDIEARCFLQPEELVDIFKQFSNKGLAIREEAEKYLKESGKQWILRNCSLKDTDNAKAYALTILYGGVPYSFPIVHRIGDGFYFNVSLCRGDSIDKFFTFKSFHITIIDLLKTVLKNQLEYYLN